jgi:hypothetical protein
MAGLQSRSNNSHLVAYGYTVAHTATRLRFIIIQQPVVYSATSIAVGKRIDKVQTFRSFHFNFASALIF